MRDNPVHVAAFGPDPEKRARGLRAMFTGLFKVMRSQRPICARDGEGRLVGVAGVAPPGTCRPGAWRRLGMFPYLLARGPYVAGRVAGWSSVWARSDLDEPHSHLGPFAVRPELQGRGIGSRLLEAYTGGLDREGAVGYLETDRERNVGLYERFGFEVVGTEEVLGERCWYMRRPAGAARSAA